MSEWRDQYTDRLIYQYYDKPNASAEVDMLAGVFEEVYEFFRDLPEAYDLDTAVGEQLDVIGRIVDQGRSVPEAEDDEFYRTLLRFKIAINNVVATVAGLEEALEFITGEDVVEVEDGFDMTFRASFFSPISAVTATLLTSVERVPSPQGVRFSGFLVPEALPKFGVTGVDESPANEVEGFGELGMHALEFEDGTVLELEDGTALGMIDQNDPVLPTEGGKLTELYEV